MRLCLIAAAVLVSACQLALPGRAPDALPVNPITAGQVIVSPLDPPPDQTAPVATDVAAVDAPGADTDTSGPVAVPAPAVPDVPARSSAQIACEKSKGIWITAGKTGIKSCQTPLRDSGKQCRQDRDCEGQCLARSRTCAPYTPLFGCHEVLQDNGQQVTVCLD